MSNPLDDAEERPIFDPLKAKLGLPQEGEESAETLKERALASIRGITVEDIKAASVRAEAEHFNRGGESQVNSAAVARAFRSNMVRRLDKVFDDYEEFSPEEAVARCKGVKLGQVEAYLNAESARPGARVRVGPTLGKFMLINPFVE